MGLIRGCFPRTQTWLQAGKYVNALVSDLPSRNGWSVAEMAGDRSPARMQRLLNRASWDEAAAMSQVRRYAAAGLDAAARRPRRQREYLQIRGQAYVLRVASSFTLTLAAGTKITCAGAVKKLLKAKKSWEVRSAGPGSKGERWYAWA
jgi:hypothetical protein